jgi:hypothetical protein
MRDDYLDYQLGWTGHVRYFIGYQIPIFPATAAMGGQQRIR